MKEYSAKTGGRYTYADDLLNLQALALSFSSIFDKCDNFIISGCEVNSNQITAGYVYINGKIRYFNGASSIASWPQYIYEKNSTENIAYESGVEQEGRTVYACEIASSIPTSTDPVTGLTPAAIQINQTGGLTLKDAFVGKYALLLNPANSQQTVSGNVSFDTVAINNVSVQQEVKLQTGNNKTRWYYQSNQCIIQSSNDTSTVKLVFNPNTGISFYHNDTKIFETTNDRLYAVDIKGDYVKSSGVMMQGYHIMDYASLGTGRLYINYLGYNGGNTQFRNTTIGNGKREAIVEFNGEDKSSVFYGAISTSNTLTFTTANNNGITWAIGSNNAQINTQSDSGSMKLNILNPSGDIVITGKTAVDIGPIIKEGGVSLSTKYVSVSTYNTGMANKANAVDVYDKTTADSRFIQVSKGFKQFAGDSSAQADRRAEIGAVDLDTVKSVCPTLSNYLSDMAKTAQDKQKICANIGAAEASKVQNKLVRTISDFSDAPDLCAIQYGNMVTITGSVVIPANAQSKNLLLPNNITGIDSFRIYSTVGTTYSSPLTICRVDLQGNILRVMRNKVEKYASSFSFTLTFAI